MFHSLLFDICKVTIETPLVTGRTTANAMKDCACEIFTLVRLNFTANDSWLSGSDSISPLNKRWTQHLRAVKSELKGGGFPKSRRMPLSTLSQITNM